MLVGVIFKSCPAICKPCRNNSTCLKTMLIGTAMSGELLSDSCCNFVTYLQIHATQISDLTEGHYFIWQLSFVTSCQVVYRINTAHWLDYPPHGTYPKDCVHIPLQLQTLWWQYLRVSTYRSWAVRHFQLPLVHLNITS